MNRFFLLLCIFANLCVKAELTALSHESYQKIAPYLIKDEHVAKKLLDHLFEGIYPLSSREYFMSLGFTFTEHQGANVFTARHHALPGYLVKGRFDSHAHDEKEWRHYRRRIIGGHLIRDEILRLKYQKTFEVPHQWIYLLPIEGKSATLMIVQDMDILNDFYNLKWYQEKISKKDLNKIYALTTNLGLYDCCRKTNLPRTRHHTFAFIDTETYHEWPVAYERLLPALNPIMQIFWKKLYQGKGQ